MFDQYSVLPDSYSDEDAELLDYIERWEKRQPVRKECGHPIRTSTEECLNPSTTAFVRATVPESRKEAAALLDEARNNLAGDNLRKASNELGELATQHQCRCRQHEPSLQMHYFECFCETYRELGRPPKPKDLGSYMLGKIRFVMSPLGQESSFRLAILGMGFQDDYPEYDYEPEEIVKLKLVRFPCYEREEVRKIVSSLQQECRDAAVRQIAGRVLSYAQEAVDGIVAKTQKQIQHEAALEQRRCQRELEARRQKEQDERYRAQQALLRKQLQQKQAQRSAANTSAAASQSRPQYKYNMRTSRTTPTPPPSSQTSKKTAATSSYPPPKRSSVSTTAKSVVDRALNALSWLFKS